MNLWNMVHLSMMMIVASKSHDQYLQREVTPLMVVMLEAQKPRTRKIFIRKGAKALPSPSRCS